MMLRVPDVDPSFVTGLLRDEADRAALMKNDVFISYASSDIGAAEAIVTALEGAGLRCFMAPRDIPAGIDRATAIVDAIFETKLFLLLYSAHANQSQQLMRELQLAQDRHIGIFPVRLDKSLAVSGIDLVMRRQSAFDAFPPLADHLSRLVEAIQARLGSGPRHHEG
ncbi:MAG TPA: toll/interleukin-1 receptor domain-containing protein [Rhizomicrobium sp.]|jgi:hypothetical protein|nr:toll/interleukin-1 receptor domain-containing protein [Rhizomicrobium sp.]